MFAQVGDRLIIRGTRTGDGDRSGIITAVRNADGSPPYEVRWSDNDHVGVIFPGADAVIETSSRQ